MSKPDTSQYLADEVTRAPFRVVVTVNGTIDSMKNATLASKVEGQTTIISIVDEGTLVKEGDLLCELDSAELIDKEKQQQIAVTQAEADLKQSIEELEIQKRLNESVIAEGELKVELAKLDLRKYREGESVQKENEIRGEITVAEEELARAIEDYEFSKRMAKKGYRSQNDLEADRLKVTKAEIQLNVAKEKLNVLKKYTYERTIRELEQNAEDTVGDLERDRRKGIAAMTQIQAAYTARELTLEVKKEKLEQLREQIAACKIYAPQDGEVVYANQRSRHSEPVIIEEGTMVRERQSIIKLPDLNQLKVEAKIHESMISRIRVGLPVLIRVDAYADTTLRGEVISVSSVPMTAGFPNYDLKEYEASIKLDPIPEGGPKLKPGLTAGLEIIVSERENVLQAPVQSVVAIGTKHITYVMGPQGPEQRQLLVGETNDSMIEIIDGLEDGDSVVMNPRTHFADEINEMLHEESRAKLREEPVAAGPGGPPAGKPDGPAESAPKRPAGGDPAARFGELDQDSDGKLTGDEIPERMRERLSTIDGDGDGSISRAEFIQSAKKRAASGGGEGGGPRRREST